MISIITLYSDYRVAVLMEQDDIRHVEVTACRDEKMGGIRRVSGEGQMTRANFPLFKAQKQDEIHPAFAERDYWANSWRDCEAHGAAPKAVSRAIPGLYPPGMAPGTQVCGIGN
jgi:hypothetical protein